MFEEIIFFSIFKVAFPCSISNISVSRGLIREVYLSIYGFNITALEISPKFPTKPDLHGIINEFDAPYKFGNYYGQRIRGWFLAPKSGYYTFYSSCDYECKLYLSIDSQPQNKQLLIYQTKWSGHNQFKKFPFQKSKTVCLQESLSYYIEAIMRQDAGSDNLSIGINFPGTDISSITVIPSFMLKPIFVVNNSVSLSANGTLCIKEDGEYQICTCNVSEYQTICQAYWTEWSSWSSCNVSYGIGFMNRSRLCNTTNSYKYCYGNNSDTTICKNNCSGVFENWSEWSICNSTCVSGFMNRTLVYCIMSDTNEVLTGVKTEIRSCFSNDSCKAYWTEWSSWSSCNVSYGIGFMNRSRLCNTTNSNKYCYGNNSDTTICKNNCSAIFESWSEWSICNSTCVTGFMNRTLVYCIMSDTNEVLTGVKTEIRSCFINDSCQEKWYIWGECSRTCGYGLRYSSSHTFYNTPKEKRRIEVCINKMCPVDSMWSSWVEHNYFSYPCNNCVVEQKRYCKTPSTAYNGYDCFGLNEDFQYLDQICPVNGGWTEWSYWSLCNVPCQVGNRTRHRDCTNPLPKYGGIFCHGTNLESEICTANECKKVSLNLNLFFMDEEYVSHYSFPNNKVLLNLKTRIKNAVQNLYFVYNEDVQFDILLHSMK